MVAKRFFYICAGILCLALAYHLGALSATAQSGPVEAGNIESNGSSIAYTCAVGRTVYSGVGSTPIPTPVPGSARIVATTGVGVGVNSVTAMLENGDLYAFNPEPSVLAWQYLGNMIGSATPATRETWGGVKARYRPGAAATPQDK